MRRDSTIPRFALPFEPGDFRTALGALLRREIPQPDAFAGLFPHSSLFWTASGRGALSLLLEALRLPPGAGVAIPLFTDTSVAEAVHAAGCRPIFVDVEEETLTMSAVALARTQQTFAAVLPAHLFGQAADIANLLRVAGGAPVIEDTAHAPYTYIGGKMAGEFGAACVYSFASTKYWPAGGGGLAIIHDSGLAESFRLLNAGAPASRVAAELGNLFGLTFKALLFSRALYGPLAMRLRSWTDQRGLLEPRLETRRIAPSQAALALRQAALLPERVERQRRNSLALLSLLSHIEGVVLPRERPGARYNYHIFPVLVRDAEERSAIVAGMLSRGVDTSRIYYDVVEHSKRFGYISGCPVSESIATRLLTLPNYASLSEGDVGRVARCFEEAVDAYRGRVRPETGLRQAGVAR